jgi:hypothetical protein
MKTEHIAIGAPVKFWTQEGHVLSVRILPGNQIAYEIGYWCGASLDQWKEDWFPDSMVHEAEGKPKLGFAR